MTATSDTVAGWLEVPTVAEMERLGHRLAALLRPGDLVVLAGELGAGKTALTRGIGAGLGVRGPVTSPTFVLTRVHPSLASGPALVHVDAYRLGDLAEVDDLDLDVDLETSVTVVEWGRGKAEQLSADRLEVDIARPVDTAPAPAPALGNGDGGDGGDELRLVAVRPVGRRWDGVDLTTAVRPPPA